MRDYGKVLPQFWTGQTGRSLRGNPTAQIVALYLQTSPHANMIGVFHCPVVYIAHETGCPMQGATKALRTLSEAGFLTWDEASDLVWVHEMARFQIGEALKPGDKRVVAIRKEFEKLPAGQIRRGFHARYRDAFHLGSDTSDEGPSQAPPKPLRSQYQEQEQEQEQDQKQEQEQTSVGLAPDRDGVHAVFDHWQKVWGHEKAHLDAKRRKVIQAALAGYSVADLCRAITGYRTSPHHTGQNDRATVYDDIGLLLRDAAHIDAGLRFADQPPHHTGQSALTRKNVAAVADWRPPELRNGTG